MNVSVTLCCDYWHEYINISFHTVRDSAREEQWRVCLQLVMYRSNYIYILFFP